MTLSIKGLYVTLSSIDTQHNNGLHNAECHAECRVLFFVMLSAVAPLISTLEV
jgi:hypothetical protein